MNVQENDIGVLMALGDRMLEQRLPRALRMKDKVDGGGLLDDNDIEFLKQVFEDSVNIRPIVDRHPEYQEIAARMMHLYKEITNKALENEKDRDS